MSDNDKTYFKLVQPGTEEPGNAHPGQFLDPVTMTGSDTLHVSRLEAVRKRRVLFVDRVPVCKSLDGIVPEPEGARAVRCAECQETKCAPKWTVEGVANGDVPFAIDLSRSSEKTAVQLEALVRRYGGNVQVDLTTKAIAGKLGRYFALRTANVVISPEAPVKAAATDDIPF